MHGGYIRNVIIVGIPILFSFMVFLLGASTVVFWQVGKANLIETISLLGLADAVSMLAYLLFSLQVCEKTNQLWQKRKAQ